MAKKKSAGGFNMSQAIREVLSENPNLGGREVREELGRRYPNADIKDNSFSVAFYTARNKLGIGSRRRRRRKGGRGAATADAAAAPARTASRQRLDFTTLQSAARFLTQAGSAEAAMEALKQVQNLQVK
jgi:hypothetical protein